MMYKTMWENDKADGTVYYDEHFDSYMFIYCGDEIFLGKDEESAYREYSDIMDNEAMMWDMMNVYDLI